MPEQLLSDVRTREAGNDEEDDDEDRRDCEPIPPEADPDLLPAARAFTSAGASVSTKTSVGTGSSCEAVVDTVNLRREELHLVRLIEAASARPASRQRWRAAARPRRARARALAIASSSNPRALSRNADACVLGSRLIAASSSMPTTLGRAERRVMSIRLPTCVRAGEPEDTGELTPAADSELAVRALQRVLHRAYGNDQPLRDLPVRRARCSKRHDLTPSA